MQFRVGVMILATILIAAILVLLFVGSTPALRGSYPIYIKFKEAPGVSRFTPVRKAGIRIGRVTDVQFTNDDSEVLVTAEIDSNRHIYQNEVCRAASSILMGDATLEFVKQGPAKPDDPFVLSGGTLEGQSSSDAMRSIAGLQRDAATALGTVDAAGRKLQSSLDRVNGLIDHIDQLVVDNKGPLTAIVQKTDKTLDLLQQALASSNDILGDPKLRQDIKLTIGEMPLVLKETRGVVEKMGGSMASLEANLKNVEGLTRPLGERGEALVMRLDSGAQKLDLAMDQLLKFSKEVNDPQGSLGALLHDRELYQSVHHVVKNIDDIVKDLRPILNDARIFTDKIARHPEMLGVRGALKKDAGLKDPLTGDPDPESSDGSHWQLGSRLMGGGR